MASSFLPPQGFGVPSLVQRPSASPASPTASAGSYVNQQLAGLLSGRAATVGSGNNDPAAPRPTADPMEAALNPVQKSATDTLTSLKSSNDRIGLYQQAAQRKKMGGGLSGGSMAGAGQAWTPDGNLSAARNRALALASTYMGTPYVLGGTSKKGIDCSGLVMMVYNQLGYNLNHSSRAQGRTIPGVRTNLKNLRPGDIVAWKDGSHIAIYAGNGQIIEAARPGTAVRRVNLWANPNAVYGIALRLPGE